MDTPQPCGNGAYSHVKCSEICGERISTDMVACWGLRGYRVEAGQPWQCNQPAGRGSDTKMSQVYFHPCTRPAAFVIFLFLIFPTFMMAVTEHLTTVSPSLSQKYKSSRAEDENMTTSPTSWWSFSSLLPKSRTPLW